MYSRYPEKIGTGRYFALGLFYGSGLSAYFRIKLALKKRFIRCNKRKDPNCNDSKRFFSVRAFWQKYLGECGATIRDEHYGANLVIN
jgi:hypothetical protein